MNLNISIVVENKVKHSLDDCCTRCLKHLPVFTLTDIDLHRLSNGKDKNTVLSKTLKDTLKAFHDFKNNQRKCMK